MHAYLGPNLLFLYGNQSHWIRTHPKDLILICHLFKNSVSKHSEVLWHRTQHFQFSSVQLLSQVQLFATPWTAARQVSLSIPTARVYQNPCPLSRWCHPTISSSVTLFSSRLQSFPASGSFLMSLHIRWPNYWSFRFSISPSSEYSGLVSFRIDWLDLFLISLHSNF